MKRFFTLLLAASCLTAVGQDCTELFFSEYVEGFGNNRALEIYNPTNEAVDLNSYRVARYSNGSTLADSTHTIGLTGIIDPYGTVVLVLDKRDSAGTGLDAPVWEGLEAVADLWLCPDYVVNRTMYFNGNDAMVLFKDTTVVDIFGQVGWDPGDSGWGGMTKDHTLIRKSTITYGNIINDPFVVPDEWLAIEWTSDTLSLPGFVFANLGGHNCVCGTDGAFGCMDPDACNYSAEAQFEDNSCHYLCQACLDGTTWSEELQGCVVDGQVDGCSLIYDGDNDGLVGSSDLLGLLTEFGAECTPETAFSCGNPVSYQGYDYETVQIGEQCWFAENLRAENYKNGDVIPAGLSDSEWENTTLGAIAVYGEGSSQCFSYSPNGDACDEVWSLTEYGRLYNWYAVDDSRGLCPSNWHIPSDEEWMTMEIFLGMSPSDANGTGWRGTDQGVQMRSVNELCSGTNSSGFSGMLGGQRYPYGSFSSGGSAGYWWSSTPIGESAWERNLLCADEVFRYGEEQKSGFSIRCLKD